MTRLLLFIAAYFASSLAVDHAHYGAGGDMKLSAGSKSYGQAAEGSGDAQGLNVNANYGEQKSQAGHGYAGVQEPSLEAGENKTNGHAGKGDDVQAGSDVQELNTDEGAKNEPTKGIKVIAKGQGGEGLMEHLGEPAMPPGKTHQVTVGGSAGLTFIPDSLVAEPGDMVQFHFLSKNHTVTQSGFAKPCVKLADGADSGFMPNPDETLNPPPTYKFQVMDKSAIWFYCKQKGHCGMGMTFSINPTEEKSQAKFRQLAMEQNGTANGSDGANGGYASPPAGSPSSIIPPPAAGTGVAASGVPPAPLANSTIYSVPALPPGQENKAPGSTGIVPPAPGATQPANVVKGTGNTDSGQCQCSCLCGVASFPAGSGVGSWGGMSGAVPV